MDQRKIAIVGKAPSSLGLAPYDDESWEIWTLCDLVQAGQAGRWTRHFELHPLPYIRRVRLPYYEWLTQQPAGEKPIYLQATSPEVPAGMVYPKDAIVKRFGGYFTNTVSWMLALAIYEGCRELALFGVDMAQDTEAFHSEYRLQRPSCEFFLGWAVGAGIKIHVPPECDLLKTRYLYGFESGGDFEEKWKARTAELKERYEQKQQQAHNLQMQVAFLEGGLQNQEYFKQWF